MSCTATDQSGNTASGLFTVSVKGAAAQLGDLYQEVQKTVGPGTSLADMVARAQIQLAAGDVAGSCRTLTAFINHVRAQSGKGLQPAARWASQVERITPGCLWTRFR